MSTDCGERAPLTDEPTGTPTGTRSGTPRNEPTGTPTRPRAGRSVDRRAFLGAGVAAGIALVAAACGGGGGSDRGASSPTAPAGPATAAPASPAPTSPAPGTVAPPSGPAAPAGTATFVVRGPDAPARVALTFHVDGDLALADQLLATLGQRDVPITAFVVGEWLDANPAYGKRLVDGGHEIANHTFSHPAFAGLGAAAMQAEITRCRDTLVRLTGTPGRLFRPSGTADGTAQPSDAVLAAAGAAGYPVVLGWDVEPFDYQSPGTDAIVARTLSAVRPGAVVSLHFGYPQTVAALPRILDGLAARGLTPVTASKLLGRA
ncbi:MAG: hypothetical protein AMXMBFR46_26680 [Acidimicrobiia bacterium]